MPTNDIFPDREDQFVPWFTNFATKAPLYETTLAISEAELVRLAAALPWVNGILDVLEQVASSKKEWTAYKNLVLYSNAIVPLPALPAPPPTPTILAIVAGLIPFLRGLIARMKANANYTAAIGQDLGIETTAAPAPAIPKPVGRVTTVGDFSAKIDFKKLGFDGVRVEGQQAGQTVWEEIGTPQYTGWVDDRPPVVAGQPEERRYRLQFMRLNEAVGEYSDVISVIVGP